MTLSDLSSIGSLVSGIAMLVSLIYLAQQTRQNVKHKGLQRPGETLTTTTHYSSTFICRLGLVMAITATMFGECGRSSAAPQAAGTAPPKPSQVMRDTFVGCKWGKVEGATLSVWSYACDSQHGNARLIADDTLPGFKFLDGSIAVRAFEKPTAAPIDAILPRVRIASPGAHSDTCVLAPIPGNHGGRLLYAFVPTGRAKVEWDASQANPDQAGSVEPPCGIMGPAENGDRYFEALTYHPETVVFVEEGSEIQIFDANTLKHR
jgi:hypothetical protein